PGLGLETGRLIHVEIGDREVAGDRIAGSPREPLLLAVAGQVRVHAYGGTPRTAFIVRVTDIDIGIAGVAIGIGHVDAAVVRAAGPVDGHRGGDGDAGVVETGVGP